MATTFFTSTRGCVYVQSPADNSGSDGGFYKLRGAGGGAFGGSGGAFITGSDLVLRDIISPGVALDRSKTIAVFGNDWGSASVNGVVLLGESSGGGQGLAGVEEFFQSNRVANQKEPCGLSIPGNKAYAVYLHNLTVGAADAEYHVQPFAFSVTVDED